MVNSKQLAKILGISPQAVNLARQEGRITPIEKQGREFLYDPERALIEYSEKTTQPKAPIAGAPPPRNQNPDLDQDGDSDDYFYDALGNKQKRKSVLDIPAKMWTTHEAQNAKAIYDAQLKQLELDKEAKKYLPTKDVETEVLRITTEFSRALVGLPAKIKQKIDKLDDKDLSLIRELCTEILANCEAKL